MTGLRVWLQPFFPDDFCGGADVASYVSTASNSTALRRTAAVMRNRRGVLDVAHFDAGRGQGTDRGLASGAGAADPYFHAAHAMIARHAGGVGRSLLGGKRGPLARSAEAQRTRAFPGQDIARLVGNGHNGVVERSLNVRDAMRHMLAFFFL